MMHLGKQSSTYSAFKIVKGIPIPFNLNMYASNLLNSSLRNYYYSILLTSFIGCGIGVLIIIFYYLSTNNFHLFSITIIMILGPFIMLTAIAYHYLYKMCVRISACDGIGYVIALDSTEKASGETVSKRALVCVVYSNEVYLLMSYNSTINVSIGEMVHVSWMKNNAKMCWIHSVIKL